MDATQQTKPTFTENWYSDAQCALLEAAAQMAPDDGAIIEVGCWEGKSTIALARAITPRRVYAIDHWQGNTTEGPDHASVKAAAARDVYACFRQNIDAAGVPNIAAVYADWRDVLHTFFTVERIAFAHLDAGHDYQSTYDLITAVKARLVPGGIICGDDIQTAHAGRADLDGGVERAVEELLPGAYAIGNFWVWSKDGRVVAL